MPSLMFKTKVRLLNGPEWICTRCCYCTFATQIKGTHKRRRHRGQLTMKKQLSNSQLKYIVLYLLLNVNLCLAYTNKVPYIVKKMELNIKIRGCFRPPNHLTGKNGVF